MDAIQGPISTPRRFWSRRPVSGKVRISRRLTRMLAGTIATITAAVVVNFDFLPDLVTRLGSIMLISPLIVWWNARILRSAGRAGSHYSDATQEKSS